MVGMCSSRVRMEGGQAVIVCLVSARHCFAACHVAEDASSSRPRSIFFTY